MRFQLKLLKGIKIENSGKEAQVLLTFLYERQKAYMVIYSLCAGCCFRMNLKLQGSNKQ